MKLITIGFSHFCEKARWALDRSGVDYTEESHAPLAHIYAVFRAGGKRTVPTLETDDGVFSDSTDILKYVDPFFPPGERLYPEDEIARREVEDLEELFDKKIGPRARRWAYAWLSYERGVIEPLFRRAMTPNEKKIAGTLVPLAILAIQKSMKITPALRDSELAKSMDLFASLDERLSRGKFLVGDHFTAADLTLAALSSPLVVPEENPWMPDIAEAPEKMKNQIAELRATKAGAHVLAMYRDERNRKFRPKIS